MCVCVCVCVNSRLWHRRFGRTQSLLLQYTGCTHRLRKLKPLTTTIRGTSANLKA